MTTLRELRTAHSVVVTEATSMAGWLIWTPMNSSPDRTAATPAARVRVVGVTVMSGSFVRVLRCGVTSKVGTDGVTTRHMTM